MRTDAGLKLGRFDYRHAGRSARDPPHHRIHADGYVRRHELDELLRLVCPVDGVYRGMVLLRHWFDGAL